MSKSSLHRRLRRRGVTLIEVLGTMGVLLMIAISGAAMLSQVTNLGLQSKVAEQSRVDVARMATMFRTDVHAASEAELGDDGGSVELTVDGNSVRYFIDRDASAVIRRQTGADEKTSVERFALTPRCEPQVTLDDARVTLALTGPDAKNPWIIEASRP